MSVSRTVNRLERKDLRRVEDFLLTMKPAIEEGKFSLPDLVSLCKDKLSLAVSESTISSSLNALSIDRPRQKSGGLTPFLAKLEAIEARLTALENAVTHPPQGS